MENEKAVTRKRLIDAVYSDLCDTELKRNAIETEEIVKEMNAFTDKYIEPIFEKDPDLYDILSEEFIKLVFDYCRRGFEVGFESAMVLLTK